MPAAHLIKEFASDRRGSVAIIFALSVVVLMGAMGLAVDTSRYYNFTSHMQAALDAAALAGAKLIPDETQNDSDIATIVQTYYDNAMSNAGIRATSISPLSITVDRSTSTVEAVGNATLPTLFTGISNGSSTQIVNRGSKVAFDIKKIELSMVLDITGSMNNKNKIGDLKLAANDVIDELYNASLSEDGVRIALAPYSASVNAGALAATVSAAPPSTACTVSQQGSQCDDSNGVAVDTCVIERIGPAAATDDAPVGANKLPNAPTPPPANYFCPSASVVPLLGKSNIKTLKGILGGYTAAGGTAGHIGTAWGWYLLSPDWASVLPAASAPKPYGDATVEKSMIIMTDGIFNTSYLTGSLDATVQANESYAQFDALCDGAKAKGIKVYTIGFDLSDPRALSELQNCASGASFFFDAKTGADLKAAFHAIAQKLNTLHVTS